MKKYLTKAVSHPLIKGSTILLIGGNLASVLLFVFNLVLVRFFSPSDYGVYYTLVSFLALFGIFPSAFSSSFTKFAAMYTAQENEAKMTILFHTGIRIVVLFASLVLLVLSVFIVQISAFFHIVDMGLLCIIFLSLFFSIITSLPIGMLTGEMRLYTLSFVNIAAPFFKIVIGFLLLFLGLRVLGVTIAIVLSSALTFLYLLFIFRKRLIHKASKKNDQLLFLKDFRKYSFQFFLSSVGMTILTSSDMLFVKHFFSPAEAGQYAALAVTGRVIFWLTAPVYAVFFPLIAQKKERNENMYMTLFLAMGITTIPSFFLSIIYFLFPSFIITFFSGSEYQILTPYVGLFSVYVIIFSISMLFNSFLLAIGKSEIYKINLVVAGVFALLMYTFHENFYQIIAVLFSTSLLLLISHLVYYLVTRHER